MLWKFISWLFAVAYTIFICAPVAIMLYTSINLVCSIIYLKKVLTKKPSKCKNQIYPSQS